MITVGLVKELYFIARALNTPVEATLSIEPLKGSIKVIIKNDILDVFFDGNHIWNEKLGVETSMFGIESCDSIARAIKAISDGDEWKNYAYLESEIENGFSRPKSKTISWRYNDEVE